MVGQFWVPNIFPKLYLNSELISLVVRSKGPSSKGCYIYGSKTIAETRWQFLKQRPFVSITGVNPHEIVRIRLDDTSKQGIMHDM